MSEPPARRRLRRLAEGFLLLFLAAGAGNAYLMHTRVLHVVNATGESVRVVLDDATELSLASGTRVECRLSEGEHEARVQLGERSLPPVAFQLEGSLLERWRGSSLFIFNVAGAATFVEEEASFGKEAPPATPPRIHFGEAFVCLREVDRPFRPFPESYSRQACLRRVDLLEAPPATTFALFAPAQRRAGRHLDYAERHLQPGGEGALLQAYLRAARTGEGPARRVVRFLAQGLATRPLDLEWHRGYQDLRRALGQAEGLRQEYAQLLAGEPQSAGLHYLSGRLCAGDAEALAHYDAAIAIDAEHAFARQGRAARRTRRAEFARALPDARRAHALRPEDPGIRELLDLLLLATGAHAELEASLRERLARGPDVLLQGRLLECCVARGDPQAAREAHAAFRRQVHTRELDEAGQLVRLDALRLAGLLGEPAEVLRLAASFQGVRRAQLELEAYLELGQPAEAAARYASGSARAARDALLLCLAWQRTGDAAASATWRARAGEARPEVAQFLGAGTVPLERVRALPLGPATKAALLLVLAAEQEGPARAEALDLAERYAFARVFPGGLLRGALARQRAE